MSLTTNPQDHIKGNPNASIELIEYADYQCPYCGQAYYILEKIQKELGDKLKFVFRNFPIPQLHPYAVHAAIAAEAAGAQGKFWEMHDILFENQKNLDDNHLVEYAGQIGLDIKRFEEDSSNDQYFQKVNTDYEGGIKLGIQGTPTFFINQKMYEGDWSYPSFIAYLKSLL